MDDNGILAHVPGQYVAQALQSLPPPATAEDRDYQVEIDAGHAGMVRITYRRHAWHASSCAVSRWIPALRAK